MTKNKNLEEFKQELIANIEQRVDDKIIEQTNRYKVTGPNGNSIILPAAGFRIFSGEVYLVGSYGYYWSSTPNGSKVAWLLDFDSVDVRMFYSSRYDGLSVRLVSKSK